MNCSPTEIMVEKFKKQKDPVEQDGQGTPTQRRNVFIVKRSKRLLYQMHDERKN